MDRSQAKSSQEQDNKDPRSRYGQQVKKTRQGIQEKVDETMKLEAQ
jgi:hypothetical protein